MTLWYPLKDETEAHYISISMLGVAELDPTGTWMAGRFDWLYPGFSSRVETPVGHAGTRFFIALPEHGDIGFNFGFKQTGPPLESARDNSGQHKRKPVSFCRLKRQKFGKIKKAR